MNYKNFWKTTLSFGLLITLLLPSVALANAKTNTLPIGLNLANNEEATLEKYSQLATTYLNDCEDLARQGSP